MNGATWDGVLREPVRRRHRISIVTTCMGRVADLARTLPANLESTRAYDPLEFVLVDYNSPDGLGDWVRREMMDHILSGRLVYYRTQEPRYYSMTHSRNIGFRLASGDIVTNLDADNFVVDNARPAPQACFAEYLNRLANQFPQRAIFAKGKRGMHGRIGFFKEEFVNLLGGYDEDIRGYGHDDHDLVARALAQGFTFLWFGGQYYSRIKTGGADKNANMEVKDWRRTERINKELSLRKLAAGAVKSNQGRGWGVARLVKNFRDEVVLT